MADPQPDIVDEERILERAIWRKWNKFIWSGLFTTAIGLVIIAGGLVLSPASYLIAGLGVIVVIIGVIRLLIGVINPMTPKDLDNIRLPEDEER
jgi:hypothetical protein